MPENIKVAREHRRLETVMILPPVDENLYVRTLRSRNIVCNIRHRQLDSQNS